MRIAAAYSERPLPSKAGIHAQYVHVILPAAPISQIGTPSVEILIGEVADAGDQAGGEPGGGRVREPADARIGPEEQLEQADLAGRVRRAVADLPRGQRAAVLLFHLGGLTYAETAAHLGIELGAVKTRLHKARTALRRDLWTVWMEGRMVSPDAGTPWVEMRVTDVRKMLTEIGRPLDEARPINRHVVVLEDASGAQSLLTWVGPFEGTALAWQLEGVETPRPLTFSFMASVLQAAGGHLEAVRINRLIDETFYAEAVIGGPAGTVKVDARPSDALNLALTLKAPIFVEPSVLSAEASAAPDRRQPRDLAEVRRRSAGTAEIVAEFRETWMRKGAEDPPTPPVKPPAE